jgi:hypothetical protein
MMTMDQVREAKKQVKAAIVRYAFEHPEVSLKTIGEMFKVPHQTVGRIVRAELAPRSPGRKKKEKPTT